MSQVDKMSKQKPVPNINLFQIGHCKLFRLYYVQQVATLQFYQTKVQKIFTLLDFDFGNKYPGCIHHHTMNNGNSTANYDIICSKLLAKITFVQIYQQSPQNDVKGIILVSTLKQICRFDQGFLLLTQTRQDVLKPLVKECHFKWR